MKLRFALVSSTGVELPLPPGRHTLGSGVDADLELPGAGLQPVHLVLTVSADRIFCQARRPELRFEVNGKDTTGDVLRSGDELRVGELAFKVTGDVDEHAAEERLPAPEVVRTRGEQVTLERHYQRLRQATDTHPISQSFDVMYRLAGLVSSVHEQEVFHDGLLDLVLGMVHASRAFLVWFDRHGNIEVLATRPAEASAGHGPSMTILGRVWLDGISLISADTRHDPRLASSASIATSAIRTAICAPICFGDEVSGAIYADGSDPRNQPTLDQLTLLESIASFAGMALGRAKLYQELKQRELHTHLLVHDLKNPLYAIVSGLNMLEHQLEQQPGRWKDTLGIIRRATGHLEGFISDILSVAHLEESRLAPRRDTHDLARFLRQIEERWRAVAGLGSVSLKTELDPPGAVFELDMGLFDRVVANLIDNAVQHAPGGSRITVRAARRDGELRVEVADQGDGVPEELRDKIFEKFARADAKNAAGKGLGLYFCRLAVEAHGGSIWVEGGRGDNRFVFTLPEPPAEVGRP